MKKDNVPNIAPYHWDRKNLIVSGPGGKEEIFTPEDLDKLAAKLAKKRVARAELNQLMSRIEEENPIEFIQGLYLGDDNTIPWGDKAELVALALTTRHQMVEDSRHPKPAGKTK